MLEHARLTLRNTSGGAQEVITLGPTTVVDSNMKLALLAKRLQPLSSHCPLSLL